MIDTDEGRSERGGLHVNRLLMPLCQSETRSVWSLRLRTSIKVPPPALHAAREALADAAEDHLSGDSAAAERLFHQADSDEVWHWLHPAWLLPRRNVLTLEVAGDSQVVPQDERDPDRRIGREVRVAVLARDGHRCRYCEIEVIASPVRDTVSRLYPSTRSRVDLPHRNHAAFDALWLQYDHVVPHCRGGSSTVANVVISCGLCNFGKDKYTLAQLGLSDPRERAPRTDAWDGLEKLLAADEQAPDHKSMKTRQHRPAVRNAALAPYFIAGAWISSGYVYTPPLEGRQRWFRLSSDLTATDETRNGVSGVALTCAPEHLVRRGMTPRLYTDSASAPD